MAFVLNHHDGALASAGYLIVDECSMVDTALGEDVLSFGKPVLALGDPFQLPPPEGHGFFTNGDPDVLLTEVHRHQDDGGIIDLATAIRLGESIDGHPMIENELRGYNAAGDGPSWSQGGENACVGRSRVESRDLRRRHGRNALFTSAHLPVARAVDFGFDGSCSRYRVMLGVSGARGDDREAVPVGGSGVSPSLVSA